MSRRPDRRGERGAVMVETALIAGTILTLLVFSIQVGVLGFLQLTADAAAFVNARETALGFTQTATTSIFPQIAQSNISSQYLPAPQPSVPPVYGYNSTNATVAANSAFNRNGGVSMMEPELTQTTVSKLGVFKKFGMLLGVAGLETEAFWQECGIHDNIANDTSACGDTSDSIQNQYGTFSGNYFTKGENTPPYFVSFNYIQHCTTSQPWPNSMCATNAGDYIGLGVAEYLDNSDWNAPNDGVSGGPGFSTFQATACHQRVFAAIAQFFALFPTESALYAVYGYGVCSQLYNNCNTNRSNNFSDFSTWNAFDSVTNGYIQQIYSWDHRISGGYPVNGSPLPTQYPLNPENGC